MDDEARKASIEGSWDELIAQKDLFSGMHVRIEVIHPLVPGDFKARYRAWRQRLRAIPADETEQAGQRDLKQTLDEILVEKYRKQGIKI
jgi:hypothetical protein